MNILITGAWHDAQNNIAEIERMGHTVCFMQNETDALPCEYDWVEGVICNGLFLTHDIQKFINLKYIQLTSAGFDRVPMDYIQSHNIEIHNARGVYSIPMAEFAVSGVLQLYKQSRYFYENQKEHRWEKHRGLQELYGKTVCIVGCGSVGTECAKRFKAFGCDIIGVDIKPYPNEYYLRMEPLEKLDEALAASDIVVLTVPLTEETHHLMNAERFGQMKDGAVLVNIARGAVVDTEAMIKALCGKLFGAVLDVFEEEPIQESSELWGFDNVIITPHNSYVGEGNSERLLNCVMEWLKQQYRFVSCCTEPTRPGIM